MIEVHAKDLIPGKKYYVKSLSDEKSRQIGLCQRILHLNEDIYQVYFSDISEIEKTDGYGNSGLHYGEAIRHSSWFTFYEVKSIEYNKKIELFYEKATNIYLQMITNDSNFKWYT
jgi:hypothetical protein